MKNLVKNTFIVSGLNFLSLVLRLIAGAIIASIFGVSPELDAYFLGVTIPNFLSSILAPAIGVICIPILSECKAKYGNLQNPYFGELFLKLTIFISVVLIFLWFFADRLIGMISSQPSIYHHSISVEVMKISLIQVFFAVVFELFSAMHFLEQRFLLPNLLKVVGSLIFIFGALFLSQHFGVTGLGYYNLFAFGIQFLILFLITKKGAWWPSRLNIISKTDHSIFGLLIPLVFGMLSYRSLPVIERWVASGMEESTISILTYANRLIELPQQLITSGLISALFPIIVQLEIEGKRGDINSILFRIIKYVLFIYIPLAMLLTFYGFPFVQLLFERGEFSFVDSQRTFEVFSVWVCSLPVMGVCSVIGQCYYVHKNTKVVALMGMLETLVFVCALFLLLQRFSILAFPLAYLILYCFAGLANGYLLNRMYGYTIFYFVRSSVLTPMLSMLLVLMIVSFVKFGLQRMFGSSFEMVLFSIGAILYILIQKYIFQSQEIVFLTGLFKKRFENPFR